MMVGGWLQLYKTEGALLLLELKTNAGLHLAVSKRKKSTNKVDFKPA